MYKIYASRLAEVIGLNPFVTETQAQINFLLANSLPIKDDELRKEFLKQLDAKKKIKQINVHKIVSNENEKERFKEIEKIEDVNVKEELTRQVNCRRGTRDEKIGLKLVSQDLQYLVKTDNHCYNFIYNNFKITGKIDGIVEEKNCIVEIKNRQKKLFKVLKQYEQIQVEIYLRMFPAIDFCRFIEVYKNDYWQTDVYRDDELFKEIKNKLDEFWGKISNKI